MKIKSLVFVVILVAVFFCSAGFVSAQITQTQDSLTQQLIQLLTKMINQLEQEIQQILTQRTAVQTNCVPVGGSYGANNQNLHCCAGLTFQPTTASGTVGMCVASSTQPSTTIISPNGGEIWKQGQAYNIAWTSTGLSNSDIVNIMLQEYNSSGVMILGKLLTGTIDNPGGTTLGSGSYSWTIPFTTDVGNSFKIQVSDNSRFINNVAVLGISANYFSIVAPTGTSTQPSITITSPNGGEQWAQGSIHTITWISSNVNNVEIYLSGATGNGGSSIITQSVSSKLSSNNFSWTIPSSFSLDNYKISILDIDPSNSNGQENVSATSNIFSIVAP